MEDLGFPQDGSTKVRNGILCRRNRPKSAADADDPSSTFTISTPLIQVYQWRIATKQSRNCTNQGASRGWVQPVTGTPSRVVPCWPVPGGMHMADATLL